MLLPAQLRGGSKEPQPHADQVLGSPLPPSHKAPPCRVLRTHKFGLYHPHRSHPPPVPRVLGGGAGPAKRIYCSTQGALEAITFPPLDLNGFETSKRIEGAGCQSGRPQGLTPQGAGAAEGGLRAQPGPTAEADKGWGGPEGPEIRRPPLGVRELWGASSRPAVQPPGCRAGGNLGGTWGTKHQAWQGPIQGQSPWQPAQAAAAGQALCWLFLLGLGGAAPQPLGGRQHPTGG